MIGPWDVFIHDMLEHGWNMGCNVMFFFFLKLSHYATILEYRFCARVLTHSRMEK